MHPSRRITSIALLALLSAGPLQAQVLLKQVQSISTSGAPQAVAPADLDGDGDLDLAVSLESPPALELLENLFGFGTFSQNALLGLPAGSQPRGVAAADFDHDGDVDLAVALAGLDAVRIFEATPSGFQAAATIAVGDGPSELVAADLDLDGDWDLVSSCLASGELSIVRNLGGLSFTATQLFVGMQIGELGVAELSGDGLPDIAVCVASSSSVEVLRGLGAAAFDVPISLLVGSAKTQGLALGDVDGDGDDDIAYSYELNGNEVLRLFFQQAGGVFSSSGSVAVAAQDLTSLVLSDLDLDGDLDVALSSASSVVALTIENLGSGSFDPFPTSWPSSNLPGCLAVGDVDGNGGADLLVAAGADVALFENVAGGPSCSVVGYCTAKPNSLGLEAHIQSVGSPGFGPQGFSILMTDGVPGAVGIAFQSVVGPASTPFLGGTFCVQPPTIRFAPRVVDAAGRLGYAVPIGSNLAGASTWYQFWYRDPNHPDGTGAALSDALAVISCD